MSSTKRLKDLIDKKEQKKNSLNITTNQSLPKEFTKSKISWKIIIGYLRGYIEYINVNDLWTDN